MSPPMRLGASRDLLDRLLRVPGRPPLIGFIGDHQGVLHTLVAVAALLVMGRAVLSLVVAVVSHPGAPQTLHPPNHCATRTSGVTPSPTVVGP
jgi:hypothetical protein